MPILTADINDTDTRNHWHANSDTEILNYGNECGNFFQVLACYIILLEERLPVARGSFWFLFENWSKRSRLMNFEVKIGMVLHVPSWRDQAFD